MKAWLTPLTLLAAILIGSALNCRAMETHTARWQKELRTVEQSAQREDWPGASSALSRSYDGWAARQTYLHIVAEHDAVDSADALYRRCAAFIAAQDGAELSSELAGLSHQLGLLAEMERFSIKNIL